MKPQLEQRLEQRRQLQFSVSAIKFNFLFLKSLNVDVTAGMMEFNSRFFLYLQA